MTVQTKQPEEPVLVVDDDPAVCKMVKELLAREGYPATTVEEAHTALSAFQAHPFELVFVDIHMPGMTGLELAARLKEISPTCEVVFMTGYGNFDNAVQAIKVGAYDYLRKPFDINELRLCLKRFQERKALKEKVRQAEDRYFRLVQNSPSLIFVMDRDLNLEFVNRSCNQMLGYSPEEAMSIPGWLLQQVHADDRERIRQLFLSAFHSARSRFTAECKLVHRQGHLLYALIKSTPLAEPGRPSEVDRLEGIIVNITHRVHAERAAVLREKVRIAGAISAEVAHEIRNPLTAIGGFARRIVRKHPELAEGGIILHESKRLEKILERISEYLKPVEVHYEECDLNPLVRQCVEELSPVLGELGVVWELDLSPDLPPATVDREILSAVLADILRQAAREVGKKGLLSLRSRKTEELLFLEVQYKRNPEATKDGDPLFLPFNETGQRTGLPRSYRLLKDMGCLLSHAQEGELLTLTLSFPRKWGPPSP